MAAEYALKLIYFPLRARADPIKYVLNYAVDHPSGAQGAVASWENEFFSLASWLDGTADKSALPAGKGGSKQLPVLVISAGGKELERMPESHDIIKWVASRCGLQGSTPEIQAKCAFIFTLSENKDVPGLGDAAGTFGMANPLLNWFPAADTGEMLASFVATLPDTLAYLAEQVEGPYLCGAEMTYADFYLFHYLEVMSTLLGPEAVFANQPKLKEYFGAMSKLPAVTKQLSERAVAGTGQVGMKESIVANFKVPSECPTVQAALKTNTPASA